MLIRAQYRVGSDLKFLANLDMMHLMERALRRARIPYCLSEGFNPHIRMSMGTVLPVGLWGEKEYFDLEMSPLPTVDFMARVNAVLPPGLRIEQCQEIKTGTPSLMKVINAAQYTFMIKRGVLNLEAIVAEIMQQSQILIKGRGKNKSLLKDLRPGLYKMTVATGGEADLIRALVSVNEPVNIRYDELLDVFTEHGIDKRIILEFWRQGNYIKKGACFYSPLDVD